MMLDPTKATKTPSADEPIATATTPSRKTIYLFPNLLTTGALFCGFFSMILAIQQDFKNAALFIIAAAILDGLDGRIARLFHAQSKFGEQYDSLSDMISFGVAPAVVAYLATLHTFDRVGTVIAALYCLATALRLARFNVNIRVINKRYFQGLPSPAAATLIASLIFVSDPYVSSTTYLTIISIAQLVIVFVCGVLMVSNVPYYSFKEVDPRRAIPFKILLLLTVSLSFFYISPSTTIFLILLCYSLSGMLVWVWRLIRARKMKTFIRD